MISIIPNWGKHQSIDQIEQKNAYMKKYMREYREKQRQISAGKVNCKTNSKANVSEADKNREELEEELDLEEYNIPPSASPPKPKKHQYGSQSNVLLTDEEFQKLQERFPDDYAYRIETLSEGMARKGYKYKSHYLAILNWAKNEKPKVYQASTNPFLDMLQNGE